MEITIKGTPEEIERILRKIGARKPQQQEQVTVQPHVVSPYIGDFPPTPADIVYPYERWGTTIGQLYMERGDTQIVSRTH